MYLEYAVRTSFKKHIFLFLTDDAQLCVCIAYVVIFQCRYTMDSDQIKVSASLLLDV